MASVNPAQFIQQVRTEVGKVAWPSRREVFLTTIMVLLLAGFAALFFSLTDWGIRSGLQAVLNLFGS
ncbi:MAG: preprotein translocase subunit SecE [Rhodobacterales bacterium]|nr:MAG: preprotein translocase subunit SecE [Rhodobacterales bacterium]